MPTRGTIAAVVLAGGRGERFGRESSKALAALDGRPLVAHVLDAAVASGLGPVVLVVGFDGDAVAACAPPGVEVVRNEQWADGIASSLHAALMHLASRGIVHGAVVGLADQPRIGAAAWQRVGAAYDDGTAIAVATYGGVRANPVLLARDVWPEALALHGDSGARQLFGDHDVRDIACDDAGDPTDVDTERDLESL